MAQGFLMPHKWEWSMGLAVDIFCFVFRIDNLLAVVQAVISRKHIPQ